MRTVKTKNVLLILVCILVIAVASIFFISDDKKQITREIENQLNYKNITHIEVFDDNKSVVFIKNDDGTEGEIYLEKSLFSWDCKQDYSFIREGVVDPIHLSFFQSPFNNEQKSNAVLLRVLDGEISTVKIEKGKDIIHNFELLKKGSGERFGLFRSKSNDVFGAKLIAHNKKGEVVFTNKISK
ncbi:hypothetical protein ACIQAA_27965 [Neobacillus sp. NPDC093182]|uniref:hypothetical protein n=1 Tax=Neobacillus sp. NPDC093182 TaxID=3364297 RepID=UPI0038213836